MRGLLEQLNLEPAICMLYIGHNDGQLSAPRQSLASLEKGEDPSTDGFVQWVTLREAQQNIEAMSKRCKHLIAMQEYSIGNEDNMREYGDMLSEIPGIVYADAAEVLQKEKQTAVMLDEIHPNNQGHRILGRYVSQQIRDWSDELK